MNARSSARILEQSLEDFRGQLTAADAAARTGLPTREAAAGLALVASEYSGHLAVTSKGELIYDFSRGLVPGDRPGLVRRIGRGLARAAFGAVRLVVRAWISVVLVSYAVVFAGVLLALAAKEDSDGIGDAFGLLARLIFESIFWTFHPFSSVYVTREPTWVKRRGRGAVAAVPFYEKVNRFVFGPPVAVVDPLAGMKSAVLEIRRQQGRVTPADVLRVLGGTRAAAERMLLRLVAEHEGDIQVGEEGGIVYEFPALRATADASGAAGVPVPAWARPASLPALTGNSLAFNWLFTAVNGFNLVAGGIGLSMGLTIERLLAMLARAGVPEPPPLPAVDGVPLALGLVPFLFSAALFAVPLARWLGRGRARARVADENRVGLLLKTILAEGPGRPRFRFSATELAGALAIEGRRASDDEIERAVRAVGGSLELADEGGLFYAFDELAREDASATAARALASSEEAAPGKVVLSSADPGHGLRADPDDEDPRLAGPTEPAPGARLLK